MVWLQALILLTLRYNVYRLMNGVYYIIVKCVVFCLNHITQIGCVKTIQALILLHSRLLLS